MNKILEFFSKYLSRKFILTAVVLYILGKALFTKLDVSDPVAMLILSLIGGVGIAYGFINVKDAKIGLDKKE